MSSTQNGIGVGIDSNPQRQTFEFRKQVEQLLQNLDAISTHARLTSEQQAVLASLSGEVEKISSRIQGLFRPELAAPRHSPTRSRILFVDDDDGLREAMFEMLGFDFEVRVAANGHEAAQLAATFIPDLIITDLTMPSINGLALISMLQGNASTKQIPVLVMSGREDLEAKLEAFKAGAFDYVSKPVSSEELLARARNALARSADLRQQQVLQSTDDLTGLANRRCLREFLQDALKNALRVGTELSVVMLDQDALKAINDQYGHAVGDAAIQIVAKALNSSKRVGDFLARLGGDEFVAVLPGSSRAGALKFIARMRSALDHVSIPLADGEHLKVSVSCGIACFGEAMPEETWEELLSRADQELYLAKKAKPNRHLPNRTWTMGTCRNQGRQKTDRQPRPR